MDNQTLQYGQQNFSLPHDVVPLPSGGIFYKNKKSSVKVGYLTANDENILMGGGDNLSMNLIRAKLYEPDIKPEEMLESDIEAILIFLRNTAFGPDITMTVNDPKTNKAFETTISLEELSIKKGIEPDSEGLYETKLPMSNSVVKIRPITLGEVNEIQSMVDKYPKGRPAPRVTWKLEKQIVELDGSRDRQEISKFINEMLIADSKHIKRFLDENEPRLNMEKIVTTPSGDKLTVYIGFGVEFFRPFFS